MIEPPFSDCVRGPPSGFLPVRRHQEKLEPAGGFEPSTRGLRNRCSTPELRWPHQSIANRGIPNQIRVGCPWGGHPAHQQCRGGLTVLDYTACSQKAHLGSPTFRAGAGRMSMRRPVRGGGVGVVAATWALFFPPSRPRGVLSNLGDTPRPPPEGAGPLRTPPGLRRAILSMTTRLGYEATGRAPATGGQAPSRPYRDNRNAALA